MERTANRSYGWQPSLPDIRDLQFASLRLKVEKLPREVDLRNFCPAVEDQGSLGSCTSCALVGNLEILENKNKTRFRDLSRLFVYYNERALEGTIASDSGASLRDGIKVLKNQGVCMEKDWPYIIGKFTRKPTKRCYTSGLVHVIQSYYAINNLGEMRLCLSKGFPFVFGFVVYDSFESEEVFKTGKASLPKSGEVPLGGHAVLAVGYNDATNRFIVRNSWGPDWGMKGYFTIPYEYLSNPSLASDFWYIEKVRKL